MSEQDSSNKVAEQITEAWRKLSFAANQANAIEEAVTTTTADKQEIVEAMPMLLDEQSAATAELKELRATTKELLTQVQLLLKVITDKHEAEQRETEQNLIVRDSARNRGRCPKRSQPQLRAVRSHP
ncbi:uncharacterized protein KRP23_13325 [Phytophthora ramorum]|uniref:uncharacterized protein n=1 Tax=Phytophthora ramorum TaxID=164328 RepID=UPI0030A47CDB|nr:hypothetical protein KRP23_13325 [Phytophthora ramorum]